MTKSVLDTGIKVVKNVGGFNFGAGSIVVGLDYVLAGGQSMHLFEKAAGRES